MKKIVFLLAIGMLLFSCRPEDNPSVSTGEVTNITATTATFAGNVTADGGAVIMDRGFCWSTSQFPTISDSNANSGTGLGVFTGNITGLSPITTYYVMAYAINAKGTAYGGQKSFTTNPEMPTVVTGEITNITLITATCAGNVTSDGGTAIIARGVCWSTTENPTIDNYKTSNGTGTGTFTSNLTSLSTNTTYYVRAYATNSEGTAYGEGKSFTTLYVDIEYSSFTDSRDDKVYKTVTIGDQVWMAENLAYLPEVSPPSLGSSFEPYYYVYGNESINVSEAKATTNYNIYGVLYNWPAAMNGASSSNTNPSGVQGICPKGWHLPSDAEWKQLEMYLGMTQEQADDTNWRGTDEGGKLKESGTSHWNSPNIGANNSSGFTALSSGNRAYDGVFRNLGYGIGMWSSSEDGEGKALYRSIVHKLSSIYRDHTNKEYGSPVRCLRDSD